MSKEKDNRKINWQKIHKRYKEVLGEHNYKTYANPFGHSIPSNRWFLDLSERDSGKTTDWLILALILWEEYGYGTAYVRTDLQQLTYAKVKNLFNVILENDYISKITKGKYDSIAYNRIGKTWNLLNTTGDSIETQEESCLYGLAVSEQESYKSTLNLPKCELFIYDEFVDKYSNRNTFIDLTHLMSTVFRHRVNNPRIVLLANTLTKYHYFYSELGIQKYIKYIKLDEVKEYVTEKGTHISCRLIKSNLNEVKKEVNSLLYGFENPLLNSITGGEWAIENYPHIERGMKYETTSPNLFIVNFLDEYFSCDEINIDGVGYVYFHNINLAKFKDRTIYSICDVPTDKSVPIEYIKPLIEKIYNEKICYYQNNEVGDLVKNIIDYR